jgi:Na+-transporting methylmalonyl-CoA/oxaloacetate decarboxylase beta subunit
MAFSTGYSAAEFFGNLLKKCGVTNRLADTAGTSLID